MSIAQTGYSFAANGYGSGARVAPALCTFTATDGVAQVNLQQLAPNQALGNISCLFVDNSAGSIPITVLFPDTQMEIDVPAFTQGFYPVFSNSQVFNVIATLSAVLGVTFTVPIQVLNFTVQPSQSTQLPNLNAGFEISVGNAAGWSSYNFTVPGSGLIYTSLTVDNSKYSCPVTISGVGINGSPWTFTQAPFTLSETAIPPTVSGSAANAVTTLYLPTPYTQTDALIPVTFRVAPAGVATATTLPSYLQSTTEYFVSPLGATITQIEAPMIYGFGAFVGSMQVNAVGLSASVVVSMQDSSTGEAGVLLFAQIPIPAGTSNISIPLNWCTVGRGGNLYVRAVGAIGTTFTNLSVTFTSAPVNASQNG